ncbi:MAG: lipopolysaccharide assembly protein LapA domain-containing protein [Candidatus Binatia bacterium]|nr:lipopolysaccharide assembly protein LapA domain-containing protein [Candidatus Binatia bacterium]
MTPKTLTALCCGFVVLIVMLQNTQTVIVHILFWQIVLPQILLIFLILLAGLLIGYLLGTLKSSRQKH